MTVASLGNAYGHRVIGGPLVVSILGRILSLPEDLEAELICVHLAQHREVDRRRIWPQDCSLALGD
jgi:hypothetical protein